MPSVRKFTFAISSPDEFLIVVSCKCTSNLLPRDTHVSLIIIINQPTLIKSVINYKEIPTMQSQIVNMSSSITHST